MIHSVIEELSTSYNITVTFHCPVKEKKYIEDYEMYNNAWCAGRDIYLGPYDNDEFQLIALFHELGHIITPSVVLSDINVIDNDLATWKTAIERAAWKYGIQAAHDMGIKFSYSAYRYAISRLRTYYTYNG